MAQPDGIELVNGVYRLWDRRDQQNLYCESSSPTQAAEWIGNASTLMGIEALPEGVVLGCVSARRFEFKRDVPFGYDYQWIREPALNVLRGTTGIRIDSCAVASISACLTADFESRVRMSDGRLRLELKSANDRNGSGGVKASARVASEVKAEPGAGQLLAALAGVHPIEWFRKTLAASCGADWRALADATGLTARQLDAAASFWRSLTVKCEAALWRALGEGGGLAELRRALEFAAARRPAPVCEAPAVGRWLASLGTAAAGQAAGELMDRLNDDHLIDAIRRLRQHAIATMDLCKLTGPVLASMSEQAGQALDRQGARDFLARLALLRDRIHARSPEALNRAFAAGLTAGAEASGADNAFLDVSFPATAGGAASVRAVLGGKLGAALEAGGGALIHKGEFESFLARRWYLDLTLPLTGRRFYRRDIEALASARVENDAMGRLLVYNVNAREQVVVSGIMSSTMLLAASVSVRDGEPVCDTRNLVFEHRFATVPGSGDSAWNAVLKAYGLNEVPWPDAKGEARLVITAPGDLVLAWSRTPQPSTTEFDAAISRVSLTLQSLMRRWLPALYFASPKRYADIGAAWPLLVYAASRPYRSRGRRDYTYDAMDARSVQAAAASAAASLPSMIATARRILSDAGFERRARFYDPADPRSVIDGAVRRPQFAALLSADAFLVQDMVRIAETGRELRSGWGKDPRTAARLLARDGGYFIKAFHGRLKRLYAGNEMLGLGSLVLVEATAALAGAAARCDVKLEWTGENGDRIIWTPDDIAVPPPNRSE